MVTTILHGTIVDGRKQPAFVGHIRIENDRIVGIYTQEQQTLAIQGADRVIDAKGAVVCPGFVDTHSHMDVQLLRKSLQESLVRQGITTSLLGQDGVSLAPISRERLEEWSVGVAGMDGTLDELPTQWESVGDYLCQLESRRPGTNVAYLVPHGNLRFQVMGMAQRKATTQEIEKMKELLVEALEQGAAGLSAGLLYVPGAYADTEELIALCKVVADYHRVFVVHQRSEADDILHSMDEILRVGNESGVHIHFSHFKVCGKENWKYIPRMLEKLDWAKREGIHVSFDQYPYIAGSTTLLVVLPPWVQEGGAEEMFRRLQDRKSLEKMRKEIAEGSKGWDNFVDFAGWDGIFLTYAESEKNRTFVGKSMQEIADLLQVEPFFAAVRLILEERGKASIVDFYGKEEHVHTFLEREEQNVCTDGVISGMPHPRCYGTYPRILEKYVREQKLLSLEDAIYKMTYKAAEVFGMEGEIGSLEIGKAADLVVFSLDEIEEMGTFEQPIQFPKGIHYVLIGGKVVLENGTIKEEHAGRVLRAGRVENENKLYRA